MGKFWKQCTGQPPAKYLIYFSLQTQHMYIKGRAPVVIKSIKTGQFMDFDKAKTLTASQTLLSQSLDCFVWSSAASREHSLPFLFLLLFLLGFLWWLAVVILHQQRGVGWVFFVSLIFSLLSWAVTVLRPFFPCSYRPELNSSPHLAPPKPDIAHQFVGIGSPHSALLHLTTCVYLVAIIPPPFCS